jgi:hypothetical protein
MLEQSFSLPHSLISLGCVRVCVSHNETTQSPSECRVARNVLVTFRSVAVVSQHPRELASSAVVSVDKLGAHSCARVAVQYHSCHQQLIEMNHSSRDVLPLAISRILSAQSDVTGSGVGSIPAGCVTAAMAFSLEGRSRIACQFEFGVNKLFVAPRCASLRLVAPTPRSPFSGTQDLLEFLRPPPYSPSCTLSSGEASPHEPDPCSGRPHVREGWGRAYSTRRP